MKPVEVTDPTRRVSAENEGVGMEDETRRRSKNEARFVSEKSMLNTDPSNCIADPSTIGFYFVSIGSTTPKWRDYQSSLLQLSAFA